jgi:two-component system sensor histidine kinase UhpB
MGNRRRSPREISEEIAQIEQRGDSKRDELTLLHEVHVYQEELVVQNEELLRAQATLEETRDRFMELYDFAPTGYLTFDDNGIVLQINLTGALMLGKRRDAVEGMPLLGFVQAPHRSRFLDFLLRCRSNMSQKGVWVELPIRMADGIRDIQLMSKFRRQASTRHEFFTAMIDVTDRRLLEAEREAAAREHAALASRLITIQDEERHRIARDLHDNVGQQVTALRLIIDIIGAGVTDVATRERVAQAHSVVAELDKRLDFLTGELRPVALDLGAVVAIRQFVDEWSATFGIAAELNCTVEHLRLKPKVETHLYRVVQEALNNVSKHAAATHVYVNFPRRDQLLVLTVSDDGCGFDLDERARARALEPQPLGRGLGLVGMRERALIINATIDVQSTPGRGTTVVLQAPLVSCVADQQAGAAGQAG